MGKRLEAKLVTGAGTVRQNIRHSSAFPMKTHPDSDSWGLWAIAWRMVVYLPCMLMVFLLLLSLVLLPGGVLFSAVEQAALSTLRFSSPRRC